MIPIRTGIAAAIYRSQGKSTYSAAHEIYLINQQLDKIEHMKGDVVRHKRRMLHRRIGVARKLMYEQQKI